MKTLRIAMPKGRLMKNTLKFFAQADLAPQEGREIGRKLVVPLHEASAAFGRPVELLIVKNADVPTYLEPGVAEIGICGTDVLDETAANVLRPYTFPFGRCNLSIAGPNVTNLEDYEVVDTVTVASKLPRTTADHFEKRAWHPEGMLLDGAVDIGEVMRIAAVIVARAENGNTRRESAVEEREVLGETSVELVASRSTSRSQKSLLGESCARVREVDAGLQS